jgi:uncharacterized protein (DUF4415 family)
MPFPCLHRPLTAQKQAKHAALAALPDEAIDLSDVIAWFKAHTPKGDGYRTHINRALRQYAMAKGAPEQIATEK